MLSVDGSFAFEAPAADVLRRERVANAASTSEVRRLPHAAFNSLDDFSAPEGGLPTSGMLTFAVSPATVTASASTLLLDRADAEVPIVFAFETGMRPTEDLESVAVESRNGLSASSAWVSTPIGARVPRRRAAEEMTRGSLAWFGSNCPVPSPVALGALCNPSVSRKISRCRAVTVVGRTAGRVASCCWRWSEIMCMYWLVAGRRRGRIGASSRSRL